MSSDHPKKPSSQPQGTSPRSSSNSSSSSQTADSESATQKAVPSKLDPKSKSQSKSKSKSTKTVEPSPIIYFPPVPTPPKMPLYHDKDFAQFIASGLSSSAIHDVGHNFDRRRTFHGNNASIVDPRHTRPLRRAGTWRWTCHICHEHWLQATTPACLSAGCNGHRFQGCNQCEQWQTS